MPVSMRGGPSGSWTGRAVPARRGPAAPEPRAGATILVVGPGCWPSAWRAIKAAAAPGFRVVLSAEPPPDRGGHNPVNACILPVRLAPQTIAELQNMVDSDRGVLLTVDIHRGDVRARGELVGRFETPFCPTGPAEGMAASLLMVQRLLGSAGLAQADRIRLQRRLAAICDAMKAEGADAARITWRLDRLLRDITSRARVFPGP